MAGDIIGSDVEALEERLVEESLGLVRRRLVGRLNVGRQLEGVLESPERFGERKLVLLDQPFRLGALPFDALALLEKQVVADAVLVVGVKELPLLRFEHRQAVFRGLELLLGFGPDLLNVAMHRRPHALALGIHQLDATIVALNRGFDRCNPVVGLRAGVLLTALADEVVVVAAGASSHPREVEPPFALVAIEAAAQVVVVAPCPFATLAVSIEQVLNLLERLLVYERLMFAFDDLAVVANVAAVVVVAQHLGDPVDAERRFLGSFRRATAQATSGEHRSQVRERIIAGCIEIEGHDYERGALRIDGDDADLPAVDDFPRIEVADRGAKGSSPGLVFAFETGFHLDGVTARAEGIDPGHNRVEQATRRRIVNSLKGRLQLAAVLLDLPQQPQRVEVVACDPGEVVEDHVVELQIGKLGEHPLQRRSLRAGAALSRLHVLGNNRSAELVRVALARLALRGDRIALGVPCLVHLTATRYPQVDRGALLGTAHDAPPPISPSSEIRCRIAETGTP